MSTLLLDISVALAVAGVLAGVAAFAATGVLRPALALTLDLLLAAGLLRLIVVESWIGIASVAAVVLIRKLAAAGIGTAPARDPSRAGGVT